MTMSEYGFPSTGSTRRSGRLHPDLFSTPGTARTTCMSVKGKIHFANGGRVFQIVDMGTGGVRRTMLRDVAHTAALVDRLDNIRFYIVACQAHDLDPENYHLNDFYASFNHTTKHVMGGCDHLKGVEQLWKLATIIAGNEDKFRARPFASVITNVISPLSVESTTLNILRFCCTHGIPATCAPAPISGATAPASLAGTLAQMHAESLAGVALSQVFQPGAKILYGAVATAMDLRTMSFTMGSVEMALMNACAVHLAKLYNLPIYASGGVTEAKRPEIQSGVEKTFSSLMVAMAAATAFIWLQECWIRETPSRTSSMSLTTKSSE
jgi:trimethylamine--corrinoid protein Co-methyltransferase